MRLFDPFDELVLQVRETFGTTIVIVSPMFAFMGFTDVTTLVYPDARHEIFNDFSQAAARADLLAWLDTRFAARDAAR